MVVASFIVGAKPGHQDLAARSLAAVQSVRVTSVAQGIVVSAECADEELPALAEKLAAAEGVVSVSLVAAFREQTPREDA